MQGRLFTLLDQGFPSYFVLLLVGFTFAAVSGAIWAKRVGQDPDVVVDLALAMLIFGVGGARILHVLADGYFMDYVHYCTDPSQVVVQLTQSECGGEDYNAVWDEARGLCIGKERDCLLWAKFWNGGLTYYGGFLGASAAAWFLLRRDRFPFWKGADMAGLTIPIGLGFGRMGCLLAGCCFGTTTSGPVGIVFPSNSPASEWQHKHDLLESKFLESLPVHPSQVYEAALALAIAGFLLLYLHSRKRFDGQIFLAFIALYAAARFIVEFFRSDDRGGILGLSTSQLIGLGLLGAAFVAHRRLSPGGARNGPLPPAIGPARTEGL